MVQPIDQGSILASGKALVPDYAAQALQQSLLGIQKQNAHSQAVRTALEVQEASREAQQEEAFQSALGEAQQSKDPGALAKLMVRFPKASEAMKRAYEMQDEAKRRTDLSQMAQIYSAAKSGRYDLAATTYEARLKADEAAGGDTDEMERAILEGLRSGDKTQQQYALASLGAGLSAMTGEDHFSSTMERLQESEAPKPQVIDGVAVDMNPRSPTYLKEVYESPYPRVVPGPNGSFFVRERVGGGAGGAAASPGPTASPAPPVSGGSLDIQAAANFGRRFGAVTSVTRSPEHNRKVGGAENSFHLYGRAVDIARKPGVSHAQIEQAYRAAGFELVESLDEGDHSHLAFAQGAARVKSKQQYDRLPKGARYIAPDGSERVKG